jgi:hypothetical protein
MKRPVVITKKFIFLLLLLFQFIFWANFGCKDSAANSANKIELEDLKKISDFPVYFLKYKGDYHFSEYLKSGTRPDLSYSNSKWGCTCFSTKNSNNEVIFGRNFDWDYCVPLLLFTQPDNGYASISMVDLEYLGYKQNNLPDSPENLSGLSNAPYLPFDGMNEKGVAVGMMAIPSAKPPNNSSLVTIGELEALRLILDYAANTNEALELLKNYNIRMDNTPIHYLISDSSGKSAIVEFVNGDMKIIPNTENFIISTNFIISNTQAPENVTCWRYNTGYSILKNKKGNLTMDESGNLLKEVSQKITIWSTIYNLKTGDIRLFINGDFNNSKTYNLKELKNNN